MTQKEESYAPSGVADALRELRGRLRRRYLSHGIGWMVGLVAALLLGHYVLDRLLNLPVLVRIVILVAIATYTARELRRHVLYPLRRPFSLSDMALLLEQHHPRLHQAIVSAVQLDPLHARGDSPRLIEAVREHATDAIGRLDLGGLFDRARALRVWSAGAIGIVLLTTLALLGPDSFAIWARRLLGAATPYPRQTFLTLEVPEGQGNYMVTTEGDGPIRVALARGADLPINVDAEGRVPTFVEVVLEPLAEDGVERRVTMSRRGPNRFREVLRRILHPVRLHAVGGDDPGTREVEVRILTPPAVTDLAVEIEPPAYTRLPVVRRDGGVVEALTGSRVTVRCRSTEPLTAAFLHFQESGEQLALTQANGATNDAPPLWAADFVMPAKADRYRIQMTAANGLSQLSPGLHSVIPVPDRPPVLQMLAPGTSLQALTPHAAFPLRLLASDDYGLTRIAMAASLGEQAPAEAADLWQATADGSTTVVREHSILRLVPVKELLPGGERAPREGDRLAFQVHAEDNRQPVAQKGPPQTFRIDLLDTEELRRRLQARLRATRGTVERALRVEQEQGTRIDLLLGGEGDGSGAGSRRRLALAAAEAGQQRVRGFLLQIRGDFIEILDAHLFNGLDPSPAAAEAVNVYLRYYGNHPDAPATDPGFYVDFDRARKAGEIGTLDLLGRLEDMFMIAHRVLEESLASALRSLAQASTAENDETFREAVLVVQRCQSQTIDGLNELLRLLEDWNDYQDVVRLTRRLVGAERDLMDRIRMGAAGKEEKK